MIRRKKNEELLLFFLSLMLFERFDAISMTKEK